MTETALRRRFDRKRHFLAFISSSLYFSRMPVATAEEFYNVLNRSGLLKPVELARVRQFMRRPSRPDALKIAKWLVKRDYVTVWQAERMLGGNSGFFLAGTYKFLDAIAEGAMGVVFKAEHLVMDRVVAVKVLSKARLSHPNAIKRFHREMRAMAALDHPNIVRAYDAGCVGETYYLVMEYIEGSDLNAWLKKYERLPIAWACEFIRQASLGLDHAHQLGVVHRDIKPANIMVAWSKDEQRPLVKILDLGLARAVGEAHDPIDDVRRDSLVEGSLSEDSDAQLTHAGTIVGTPDYLAPEQILGRREVDARSDVFSLGCTLFKLLTGDLPYSGPNLMGKLKARVSSSAPPAVKLRTLLPEADEELESILAKMLERDPDQRFHTAAEVALALAPFAETPGEEWNVLQPSRASRDSAEVGSSLMFADLKLREFFGGLQAELGPSAKEDDIPVIKSETRFIGGDATASMSRESDDALDGEMPNASDSAILVKKYHHRRVLRRRLSLAIIILLVLSSMIAIYAFWRVVTRSAPPPPEPRSWPGDPNKLIFAWRRGADDEPKSFISDPAGAKLELLLERSAGFDDDGNMDLSLVGAFHVPAVAKQLAETCRRSNEFSIEIVLAPNSLKQYARDGPARIVTFSMLDDEDQAFTNFTLGQEGETLVLRLRLRPQSQRPAEPGHEQPPGETVKKDYLQVKLCTLASTDWYHVIVTYRDGEILCYRNGVKQLDVMAPQPGPHDLSNWDARYALRFGSEKDGKRSWSGKLERAAIFGRFFDPEEADERFRLYRRQSADASK